MFEAHVYPANTQHLISVYISFNQRIYVFGKCHFFSSRVVIRNEKNTTNIEWNVGLFVYLQEKHNKSFSLSFSDGFV